MGEPKEGDKWSRWLLQRRSGGDRRSMQAALEGFLYPVRDRVLERAALKPGGTLLDVGCGDGLIGFGALDQAAGSRVIFSDISADLLEATRTIAEDLDLLDRCEFVRAPAEDLASVADGRVDAVTTRSVLIYVADKRRALAEFYRVLAPGGRVSLFEPINRYFYPPPEDEFMGYDVGPVLPLARKVLAVCRRDQPAGEDDPMLNFGERDLLTYAEEAGFREVHLELRVDIEPLILPASWEALYHAAPNPNAPTLAEAVAEALDEEEAGRFLAHLRGEFEARRGVRRLAAAYLWAVKPA